MFPAALPLQAPHQQRPVGACGPPLLKRPGESAVGGLVHRDGQEPPSLSIQPVVQRHVLVALLPQPVLEGADHGLRSRIYLNDGQGVFARGPDSGYTAKDAEHHAHHPVGTAETGP